MKPTKTAGSHTVTIWIAGSTETATKVIQDYCDETGNCFAVESVNYIYTGGQESGVRITRINYPRFPALDDEILDQCTELALKLKDALQQKSFSIETPGQTYFFTDDQQ